MSSATYVRGLACGACMAHVMENLWAVPAVTDVAVDLVAGGVSRLTVSSPVRIETGRVRDAIRRSGLDFTAGLPGGDDERRAIGVQFDRAGRRRSRVQRTDHSKVGEGAGHGSR